MIELRTSTNESLDLDESTSISFEENNPAFAAEIMEGNFTVPFTLPASPRNSKFFGYPEILELAKTPRLRYPVTLWVEGMPYKDGEIIFRSVGKNKYTVNFQTEISLLNKTLSDVKLQDLPHEATELVDFSTLGLYGGKKYLSWTMSNLSNLPNPFKVRVNGEEYEDGSETISTRIEYVVEQINGNTEKTGVTASYSIISGSGSITFLQSTAGIDAPFDVYLYDYTHFAPTAGKFWLTDYEPLLAAALNSASVDPESDFVFPTIKNEGLYSEKAKNSSGFINLWFNGSFSLNTFEEAQLKTESYIPAKYSVCPMFYLKYVLRKIEEYAGIKFIGNFVDDPQLQKLIIYNNRTIDHFETVYNKVYNHYHNSINPGDHLPNMTINEFLLGLKSTFNLSYKYNQEDNTFEIICLKDIVSKKTFVDVTNRSNPDYEFEFKEALGITFDYKFEPKDELYKTKGSGSELGPFILGGGKEPKQSTFSTLFNDSSAGFTCPITFHPGGPDTKDFTPRLLFYYGEVSDHLIASFDDRGDYLNKYSLAWKGDKGLYNIFWKDWAEFDQNTQLVKRESYLTIIDLKTFSFEEKLRIDQINYIVKKLAYTVSNQFGLQSVKHDSYKHE